MAINNGLDQQVGGDIRGLKKRLRHILPSYLIPSNVGGINEVSWPFYEQVDFDFGANPTVTPATRQTQSFQVSQEAALLLMGISRSYDAVTTAGNAGPWLIDFRDRQSARQFNDKPVPIQVFGTKGNISPLPTPMLIMPNAFFEVTMSTYATSQVLVGSSHHQFSFFGYRIRVEDADKVMSTIFG